MAHDHGGYHYLNDLLSGYFHQDCYDDGATNDDIVNEYVKTNWPYDRLGLRADIERFLHAHPDDSFDEMKRIFSMSAYPELDNERMKQWLATVVKQLARTEVA
jgi:hypothetical protein